MRIRLLTADQSTQFISTEPLEICGIISDIRIDASSFDAISFGWIPRERNVDADFLAKEALRHVTIDLIS